MFLRSVAIRNFLSLESVKLEKLGTLNVLIGKNNSGKSSVLRALSFLGRVVNGLDLKRDAVDPHSLFTDRDPLRAMEFLLGFEPREEDRAEFIGFVAPTKPPVQQRLLNSPFFRHVEFDFRATPGRPDIIHLRETRLRTEDGKMAATQRCTEPVGNGVSNPPHLLKDFANLDPGEGLYGSTLLGVGDAASVQLGVSYNALSKPIRPDSLALSWLQNRMARYFADAFFFNPFRHCTPRTQTREIDRLEQDGNNLIQVLDTVISRSRTKFDAIEEFMHKAVPDLGRMQTPRRGSDTELGFSTDDESYFTHIHDMGGGLEQLLMVGTVLLTTADTSSVFLEEPESHLHPGAQRYLLDRLVEGKRQVFLTTHSPVLLAAAKSPTIFRVRHQSRRTSVTPLNDLGSLGSLLDDIGVRNSDVLLSDAVVFVEGSADRDALAAWARTLNLSFSSRSISVLTMSGGEHAEQHAPPRSEVLEGISGKSPVPHLFLLDRDERSGSDLERLARMLKHRCHVLERRELENYLLVPRALLAAMREKAESGSAVPEALRAASEEEVSLAINRAAEQLRAVALLKRIRAELPGLTGGLMDRPMIQSLMPHAGDQNLPRVLHERLEARCRTHLEGLELEKLVTRMRDDIDAVWEDAEKRLSLVPGDELISAVFQAFGLVYRKPNDTERLAKHMTASEIPSEIRQFLERAYQLPVSGNE